MADHPRERKPTTSQILRMFRDPIWQFVGAFAGIVGVIISIMAVLLSSYHTFRLQQEVKAFQIVILAATSLVEVEPSVAEEIKLFYRDEPIENLSLFQLKVENSGTQTIREEDYAKPVKFTFPSQAEIVDALILESTPPNIGMTVQQEQNTATLSPVLLNEKDRAIVRFLVSNMPSNDSAQLFSVDARIAGVKEIKVVSAIEEREMTKGASTSFGYWQGFVAGLLAAGVFGYLLQQLRWSRAQTMVLEADETLEQVVNSRIIAGMCFFIWTMVLVAVLSGFIWLTFHSFS